MTLQPGFPAFLFARIIISIDVLPIDLGKEEMKINFLITNIKKSKTMKKILVYTGIIVLVAIAMILFINADKSEKKALQTLKTFESFVEMNELDIFEYQIDSREYSVNGHYTFSFINADGQKRLEVTQWRNIGGIMGPEFNFLYNYEGEPSFENQEVVVLDESYKRLQRHRIYPTGIREMEILSGKKRKEFSEELIFHLTFIMEAYKDTANFSFERILPEVYQTPPSFWRNDDILMMGEYEPSGR
jgi:hypothetical protein